MAWADASQRLEEMPDARSGCDSSIPNGSSISTPTAAACRCRYQSLTAGGMIKTTSGLSGLRWAVEQCFEESKTELGMAHYEVRKYGGWHHHILTTMLAHFFLWHLKLHWGKKSPSPDRVAAAHDLRGRLTPTEIYE